MPLVNLQVVQHLRPGGIETMALDLQRYLPDSDVHIVSLEGRHAEALKAWPRLAPMAARLNFLDKKVGVSAVTLWRLVRLIRQLGASSIHTHHIGPLLYGGIAGRLAGIARHVHTEHDAWHLENDRAAHLQRRLISLVKPVMVADCDMVARKTHAALGGNPPKVILNGIDTARFKPADLQARTIARQALGLPRGSLVIGCAARLEDVKGVAVLIKAFARMPRHLHLALAGNGSCRAALETLAQRLGVAGRVRFLGQVEDMPAFYQAIDVFCLPSFKEGFPLSPLEAQACGVPAVVTEVGGAPETLCPVNGIVVPPGDPQALAEGLTKALMGNCQGNVRRFVTARAEVQSMCQAYGALLSV